MKNKKQPIHVGASRYITKNNNKQPHVGADALKSDQNAITLVALVVTVIILLILAGVTINLTLGNSGIFTTAQKATKNYTEAQNKELANLNEFENTVEKVIQAPEYDPSLLKLKPGDYVKYDTGVKEAGDNGVATFRVLYDATSEYGLQIISDKNIANVTLGGNDWETGKTSYNNAIETLNKEAMKYKNSVYATDARCVGSNPNNKNEEPQNNATLKFIPTGWTTTDSGLKDGEKNYETDYNAMQAVNINNTGGWYWLASRYLNSYSSACYFLNKLINSNGTLDGNNRCVIKEDGSMQGWKTTSGFRPCITLKSNIKATSGDGASETTAYILEI